MKDSRMQKQLKKDNLAHFKKLGSVFSSYREECASKLGSQVSHNKENSRFIANSARIEDRASNQNAESYPWLESNSKVLNLQALQEYCQQSALDPQVSPLAEGRDDKASKSAFLESFKMKSIESYRKKLNKRSFRGSLASKDSFSNHSNFNQYRESKNKSSSPKVKNFFNLAFSPDAKLAYNGSPPARSKLDLASSIQNSVVAREKSDNLCHPINCLPIKFFMTENPKSTGRGSDYYGSMSPHSFQGATRSHLLQEES